MGGRYELAKGRGSGFVKLFAIHVDERLAHPLKVFVALLQEPGRGVGRIIISAVPIAKQRLKRQLSFALSLQNDPVQACDLVIRKMIENPAAKKLPCKIDQWISHK
jgi:hypothetical protein